MRYATSAERTNRHSGQYAATTRRHNGTIRHARCFADTGCYTHCRTIEYANHRGTCAYGNYSTTRDIL